MASTDMAGYDGSVDATAAGFNSTVTGWSAQIDMDSAVYSTFASNWKKSKAGTAQMTGSITGVLKYDAASHAPGPIADPLVWDSIAVVLTAFTGCTWTATCTVKSLAIGRPDPNGVSTFALNFESTGAVVQAWDEGA